MKRLAFFIILCLIINSLYANDGGYTLSGDSIHPINLLNVSVEYERIIISKNNSYEIEVYMELFNHTNTEINEYIGFEFENGSNLFYVEPTQFTNFILLFNNEIQKYDYKYDKKNYVHTLLYRPVIKPGKNIIFHKYKLDPGFGTSQGYFEYLLKTSKRWKDGLIKKLDIIIKIDDSLIDFTNNSVSEFDIIGYGKKNGNQYSIKSGYLSASWNNFDPNRDLSFYSNSFFYHNFDNQAPHPACFNSESPLPLHKIVHYWSYTENSNDDSERSLYTEYYDLVSSLSKTDLRLLRNSIYANKGFVFKDKELNEYFLNQYWYFPNPNLPYEQIILTEAEKAIVAIIIGLEKNK